MNKTPQSDGAIADGGTGTAEDLAGVAARFGLDFLADIPDEAIDSALVAGLPVDWARSRCLLPARIAGGLCVLTADPSKIADQQSLELLLGEELKTVVAPREAILRSIERCYVGRKDSAQDFLRGLEDGGRAGETAPPAVEKSEDLLQIAGEAPVTRLINLILLEAVKARSSDVHFEPFESNLRVRYRIDGTLYEQASPPKQMELALVSRLKVMAHMDIAEKRLPQDGMARVRLGEKEIDMRVSTVPVAGGERVVLRLLDRDSSLLSMSDLGMPETMLSAFADIMHQSYGMVLVTGPTGSGKTTTLYAAISGLDKNGLNIMTIEDPIEYRLPGIAQMQVKPKIGLTFATGLRHVLRQDPDVILVGEIRDAETAETAARSSLTGHLVFSTVHTNDAPSAVVRMIDMGVEPYLLAASLRAALAQRLVRRLCPKCRRPVVLGDEEKRWLGAAAERFKDRQIWEGQGCSTCLGGYRGRVGVYELMIVDPEVQEYIRLGKCSVAEIRHLARKKGMTDLFDASVEKVAEGVTSLAELMSVLGRTGAAR